MLFLCAVQNSYEFFREEGCVCVEVSLRTACCCQKYWDSLSVMNWTFKNLTHNMKIIHVWEIKLQNTKKAWINPTKNLLNQHKNGKWFVYKHYLVDLVKCSEHEIVFECKFTHSVVMLEVIEFKIILNTVYTRV